jgi:hypothetical protein
MRSWTATEQDLRFALATVADEVPEASAAVTEYLDHNEFGLAWETLVYELDRLGKRAPQETLDSLRSAATRMGEDALGSEYREAWKRLQELA